MTAPDLVHLDGPNVAIGSREFPLHRISGISAEEWKPRYGPWFVGLGAAMLAVPFVNGVGEQYAALAYGLVAVTLFAAIFQMTFGGTTYVLVLDVAGKRKVAHADYRALVDHQLGARAVRARLGACDQLDLEVELVTVLDDALHPESVQADETANVILHPLFLLTPRFQTTQSLVRAADVLSGAHPRLFDETQKVKRNPYRDGSQEHRPPIALPR